MYGKWVSGMSGGLCCHRLVPRQIPPPPLHPWLQCWQPSHEPLTTQSHPGNSHTEFMVENKGMGRGAKNENKQCTPQKKTENVLWSYDQESLEQVLNSAAADCHRLLFVVNSVKFHFTASESWLTYFIIRLVDTHPVRLVNLLNPSFIIADKRKLCKGTKTFL